MHDSRDLAAVPPPVPPPEITVRETASAALADLADLAASLPGDIARNAQVADRLAEELAETGAMLRALPGRPAAMSGHDYALLGALRSAHAAGEDVAETIARACARLAAELGGSFEVIKARPGDDENLPMYGGPGGSL